MKKLELLTIFAFVLSLSVFQVPNALAGEHGGTAVKEHGGKEHGGKTAADAKEHAGEAVEEGKEHAGDAVAKTKEHGGEAHGAHKGGTKEHGGKEHGGASF